MARFYARFDQGSVIDLNNDYFDARTVLTTSASAALLRDGLIASRSALSADIYDDLDTVNRNGLRGTYFPPNSPIFSTDNSTFVSWSNAYTASSGDTTGIVTPANYRTRPTQSVLSTNPVIGAVTPADPVKATYTLYTNATAGVTAVLNAINPGGPFARQGLNPSRTLHSIWHDPNLQYFAWDDFTPGTPGLSGITVKNPTYTDAINGNTSVVYLQDGVDNLSITASWTGQYSADTIGNISVQGALRDQASETQVDTFSSTVSNATQATFEIPANLFSSQFSTTQNIIEASYQVRFADITIPAHQGPVTTTGFTSLGIRGQILYERTNVRQIATAGGLENLCAQTPKTVYTINTGPNPARVYSNKQGSVDPGPGSPGAQYYQAFGPIDSGVTTVYTYDTGVPAAGAPSTLATCTAGGTPPPPPPPPPPPLDACAGSTFGVCPPGPDEFCCLSNGTYSCFATACSGD